MTGSKEASGAASPLRPIGGARIERPRLGVLDRIAGWFGFHRPAVAAAMAGSESANANPPSVLLPPRVRPAADPDSPYAYRSAIERYIADERSAVAAVGLAARPENRSIARFHEGPAKGLVLFFHGLDAGPVQGDEILRTAYALGYDVFAPNLPGHGLRTPRGADDLRFIPRAPNEVDWQRFEDRMFELARSSGNVHVVGLSAGGLLALQLAERHAGETGPKEQPILQQAIVFSPLLDLQGDFKLGSVPLRLGPLHVTNEAAAETFKTVESIAGKPVDDYLAHQRIDMKGEHPPVAYGTRYIDQDVVLGLIINADSTKASADRLRALPKGVQMVVTMADDTVDPNTDLRFAKRIGAEIYAYPLDQHVPHAMIYPPEDPNPRAIAKVQQIITDRLSR